MFENDFRTMGIRKGDTVLMHSSMKALGTTLSPQAFLSELIAYLGPAGTLLLPALSYENVSRRQPHFDVRSTKTCIGLLPETFRQMPGVVRSVHPTHSVCAIGRLAEELTSAHHRDTTPVGPNSPFMKLCAVGGRILMVGVRETITFMHGCEEIAHTPYCLETEPTHYFLTDANGNTTEKDMFAHDFSGIDEQCYQRAETLLQSPFLIRGKIGKADCLLYDAKALAAVAVQKMLEDPYYFVDRA